MRGAALLLVLALPAAAQEDGAPQIDCLAPDLTRPELTLCAEEAWAEADEELGEVYRLALVAAKVLDRENARAGIEMPISTEDALRAAQKAWVPYRDAACSAEAMLAAGGTAAPLLGTLCLERLTRRRIEDLQRFGSE